MGKQKEEKLAIARKIIFADAGERQKNLTLANSAFAPVSSLADKSDRERTLEWNPASYCELEIINSPAYQETFKRDIKELHVYSEGHLWWKKWISEETKITLQYSINEIRQSTLYQKFKQMVAEGGDGPEPKGFECNLPSEHLRYAKKKKQCRGMTIVERLPFSYYRAKDPEMEPNYIFVRPSQFALLFGEGVMKNSFNPGIYDLRKNRGTLRALDLYMFDRRILQSKFAGQGLITFNSTPLKSTKMTIGFVVDLKIQIGNPEPFLLTVMGSRERYFEFDLYDFIQTKIVEIVKEVMESRNLDNVNSNHDEFEAAVIEKTTKTFTMYGIAFVDISIEMKLTPEVKAILDKKFEKENLNQSAEDSELANAIALQKAGYNVEVGQIFKNQQQNRTQIEIAKATKQTPPSNTGTNTIANSDVSNQGVPNSNGQTLKGIVCPGCNKVTNPGKFCKFCGTPLPRVCPSCGVTLDGPFCSNCGYRV